LTSDDLRRIALEHAVSTLREQAPTLELRRRSEYASNPASAPELSGKAVDELVRLALIELSSGDAAAAAEWVTVARARARNRNSAFVANVLLAEARRQLAGSDAAAQERALTELFASMPLVRFQAATVVYQLFQRTAQLDARLGTIRRGDGLGRSSNGCGAALGGRRARSISRGDRSGEGAVRSSTATRSVCLFDGGPQRCSSSASGARRGLGHRNEPRALSLAALHERARGAKQPG
jgi:hypothetical protein